MTTYLGKSCSFDLPRVPFVNCRQFMYLVISPFGFEGRMWDLIVSVPDHCLSFYLTKFPDVDLVKIRLYLEKELLTALPDVLSLAFQSFSIILYESRIRFTVFIQDMRNYAT